MHQSDLHPELYVHSGCQVLQQLFSVKHTVVSVDTEEGPPGKVLRLMEESKRIVLDVLRRLQLYQSRRISIEYRYEVALVEVLENA